LFQTWYEEHLQLAEQVKTESMKLYAISDLHLRHAANRKLLEELPAFEDDWLIVAGDVGETEAHMRYAFTLLQQRFARLFWVPGNHELWTLPGDRLQERGEARYRQLVEICREYGVLTPEDPYVVWPGEPEPIRIAPLFLLYDYSFGPEGSTPEQAILWAAESRLRCADEEFLHFTPHPSKAHWCAARCQQAVTRLAREHEDLPTVLINHWPLREDLALLPRIPRFKIWCGTRQSTDWHLRFNARVVVYGHLHIRRTRYRDGVRFEEVSLGYPSQYRAGIGLQSYMREILPGPAH
jgi:3',5'-cyclic AMP phosphodiesterase CpdA